jgi:hypothetical protein
MTPEQLIANAVTLGKAIAAAGGALAAIVGLIAYGFGKMMDSPRGVSWGKNAWIGSVILFGGTAVTSIVQNIGTRFFGG